MIKKIRVIIASLMMVGAAVMTVQPTYAVDLFQGNCNDTSAVCNQVKDGPDKTNTLVQDVITTLLWVVGVASVIMIIVGGIRYALSGGDSSSMSNAKNTILYAVVGLVVSMMAYAIVGFVTGQFKLT